MADLYLRKYESQIKNVVKWTVHKFLYDLFVNFILTQDFEIGGNLQNLSITEIQS